MCGSAVGTKYPDTIRLRMGRGIVAEVIVEYMWLPAICRICNKLGHKELKCPNKEINARDVDDVAVEQNITIEGSGAETVEAVAERSGAGPVVAEATKRATRNETTLPTRNHAMEPDATPMRATSDSLMVQTLTTGSQRRVQGVTRIQAQGVHTRFLSPRQEEIIEQQQGEQSAAPSNPRNRNSSNANAMEDRVWGNNERVSESMTIKCLEERNQFVALGDSNDKLEDDISEKEDDLFSDHEIDEMLRTNTLQPRVVSGVEAGVTSSESSAQQRSTKSKTRAQRRRARMK
ncbi:hypothetical protein IFM89_034359 [Coptis chinensis]|uniref:Uncharacterized protein n=1 Tax=Coptis chinensis TaxID=261450 RepID=A0A835H7G3_9MAGN|nr:hypothetical protein IFM89_034359 [Coptis chinensis]